MNHSLILNISVNLCILYISLNHCLILNISLNHFLIFYISLNHFLILYFPDPFPNLCISCEPLPNLYISCEPLPNLVFPEPSFSHFSLILNLSEFPRISFFYNIYYIWIEYLLWKGAQSFHYWRWNSRHVFNLANFHPPPPPHF